MTDCVSEPLISRTHPAAPLADWLVWLLEHVRHVEATPPTPYLFAETYPYAIVAARLRTITSTVAAPDLGRITALLGTSNPFNPNVVLIHLRGNSEIDTCDPDFPWHARFEEPYPFSPDHFDVSWQLREELRFANGDYQPVPWTSILAPISEHYVHISVDAPELVAFTMNPDKGRQDIQTPIKPARYLHRFYPELADHVVRDLASRLEKSVPLRFATTADEIEQVYVTGPTSCMSKDEGDYESSCHPVRVYGGSDLQLAYITNDDGEPIGRALVWPEKKRFGRPYGHERLLEQQLARAGFTRGSLAGARIRRITDGNNNDFVVMPYLDDTRSFDVLDDD